MAFAREVPTSCTLRSARPQRAPLFVVHAIHPFFYLHASDPVSPRSEVEPGNFHRWLGVRESRPGISS